MIKVRNSGAECVSEAAKTSVVTGSADAKHPLSAD